MKTIIILFCFTIFLQFIGCDNNKIDNVQMVTMGEKNNQLAIYKDGAVYFMYVVNFDNIEQRKVEIYNFKK